LEVVFSIARCEGKIKSPDFYIVWFVNCQCVAQNIERCIKDLNFIFGFIARFGLIFPGMMTISFYIFLWKIATLATNKKNS
jgi:hypothetical protein